MRRSLTVQRLCRRASENFDVDHSIRLVRKAKSICMRYRICVVSAKQKRLYRKENRLLSKVYFDIEVLPMGE